jgi:hypothetical protein
MTAAGVAHTYVLRAIYCTSHSISETDLERSPDLGVWVVGAGVSEVV